MRRRAFWHSVHSQPKPGLLLATDLAANGLTCSHSAITLFAGWWGPTQSRREAFYALFG